MDDGLAAVDGTAAVGGAAVQSRSGVELHHPSVGRQPDRCWGMGVGWPVHRRAVGRRVGTEPRAGIEAQVAGIEAQAAGIEAHAGRHTVDSSGNSRNINILKIQYQESSIILIVNFKLSLERVFKNELATFRPASTGLDHTFIVCDFTDIGKISENSLQLSFLFFLIGAIYLITVILIKCTSAHGYTLDYHKV